MVMELVVWLKPVLMSMNNRQTPTIRLGSFSFIIVWAMDVVGGLCGMDALKKAELSGDCSCEIRIGMMQSYYISHCGCKQKM
jgi:hypothetical protein